MRKRPFIFYTFEDKQIFMNITEKVQALMSLPRWNQSRLARELGTSQSTVNRWLKGAEPEGHRRDQINELHYQEFGHDGDIDTVPLLGYIGAGGLVEAIDHGPESVEAPADAHPSTVAATVRGDSQLPMLADGWIIYWSKTMPVAEMLNRIAVVQLTDGRIMVKTIRHGSMPGLWTLSSLNAADIVDVAADWAAPIDWIKPRT